ncbi:MAG: hypothetical protein JNL28_01750 [Planctomycetes bacterium]|nr:hypothetical protein [Planctomycetota bacterium]
MRTYQSLLALACASVVSASALAQDSVSKVNGLPGDAVDPHDATEQINDYVVDLTSFRSSWDKVFAVAPISKANQQRNNAPLFFTGQINAQALSRGVASGVPFLRGQYALWNMPGFGVHNDPARNDPGAAVSTVGQSGYQFGFGYQDFADGDPTGTNLRYITGGIVNMKPTEPSRLFVSRVVAATNGTSDGCSLAAFGMGAVDESGNVHFRADQFGTTVAGCPTFTPFTGNNLFRVDMAARTAVVNALSSGFPVGGDGPATTWLLQNSTVTHNVPNCVPALLAGRSILIGTNFNREYIYESAPGVYTNAAPNAHLAGLADHRGAAGYSKRYHPNLFPGGVNGTAAILSQTVAGSGALRDSLAIWGIAANGNLVSPIARTLPAPAPGLDPDQPTWTPTTSQEFDHYHSQTAFQGGSAQVSVGSDQAGNLLAAGVVYYGFTPPVVTPFTNPRNYIAVARIDPLTGTTTWRAAAWTDTTGGKNIYQNGTTVIGNLRPFASGFGPTMSAPMIDSVGNVWFVGSYELTATPGAVNVGVFRAVLDPAAFSYRLELVLAQGQVFAGRNSGRNYRVDFLTLNDSDSISSGAAYSGNISEVAHLDQTTVGLATNDSRTLGGIVISAAITYDNNNDGMFVRSTGTGGVPGSPDEDYNVMLYIAAAKDCNSNGIPDDREIADGTATDSNNNGIPDSCEGVVGIPFCTGSAVGTSCTNCGNNGAPGHGCANSGFPSGGLLSATGNPGASAGTDTLVLTASNITGPGLFFQSNGTGLVQFGDGQLCAAVGITRMGVVFPVAGAASYPGGLTPNPIHIAGAPINPGDTKHYQCWYRDAVAFCTTATFNLTQGLSITWGP